MGEAFRCLEDVVRKWVDPIEDWAVRKGWLKQETDPDNPDKMQNIPRDMLGLLMLTVCEIHEHDKAALRLEGGGANLQEETADVFIRLVQLRAEFGMTTWHGLMACDLENLPYPEELSGELCKHVHTTYGAVCEAVEVWRCKTLTEPEKLSKIWEWISAAIMLSLDATVDLMDLEGYAGDGGSYALLDQWVDAKMEVNEGRPYMHGKMC